MKYLIHLLILLPFFGNSQACNPDSLIVLETRAKTTDANIGFEFNKHFSYFNPTCLSKSTLVVHLVGSFDNPSSTTLFPTTAANNGFNVILLKYPNGTAAKSACENSSDPSCYLKFRNEIIEGVDYSTEVSVDADNSINNRLIKLLQYLEANNAGQNWNNYFSGNSIDWSNIIISGHSQGGGHAAVIAINNNVKRVLMFASPNDYSSFFSDPAPWTNAAHTTQDSVYYGFNNLVDDVVNFSEQFEMWDNLGMAAFGDTVNVDNAPYPYANSHQLYTSYDTTGLGGNHSVMILDSKTPFNNGSPLFEPVWKYMLGIPVTITSINTEVKDEDQLYVYPNPFKDNLFIQLSYQKNKNYHIVLRDILNRKIARYSVTENSTKINLGRLNTGIYFVQLFSENKLITTKKIVKE